MGKDIKIGAGLAIILILFLIVFLWTRTSKGPEKEAVTPETETGVTITGSEEAAAISTGESLFGPAEETSGTTLSSSDISIPGYEPIIPSSEETADISGTTPIAPQIEPARVAVAETKKYTVKSGDTLVTIAKEFYGDSGKWQLISKANNNLDPKKLKIGMVLIIPEVGGKAKPATGVTPAPEAPAEASGERTHTIAKGDSLWKIAEKYYGDGKKYKLIMKANNITDASALKVGQVVKIPAEK